MDVPGYDLADDLGRRGPYLRRRAIRARDGRRVLLKLAAVPSATPDDLDALSREFDLLRNLSIPGVPQACDLLRSATSACLVLEDRGLNPLLRLPESVTFERLRPGPAAIELPRTLEWREWCRDMPRAR